MPNVKLGDSELVKLCSSCGLNISDDARFCSWCGASSEILVAALPVTPVATAPVRPRVAVAVSPIPTIRPVPVPTIPVSDAAQRRLRFCNRCGIRIPFGDAKTYMGLVTCADCFDAESVQLSLPTIQVPTFPYVIP